MLVCSVSLRAPRAGIAADLVEAATAAEALGTGNVVFATLVDDPASVGDFVDAYLGSILLEAASAADAVDGSVPTVYAVAVNETATAVDAPNASLAAATYTTMDGPSTHVAMSNGNLTATITTGNAGVWSSTFLNSGKFYFEVTMQTHTTNTNASGIIVSGAIYADPSSGGTNFFGALFGGTTNIYSNGTNSGKNLGATAVGDIFSFAIDLTGRLGWVCKNGGNWNADATANPATGVGGVSIMAGLMSPDCYFAFSGGAGDAMTFNFGQSAYSYTAPSGFINWG